MPAPVFRSAAANAGGTSIVVAQPAGLVTGDLLIVGVYATGGSAAISASNAGQTWTAVATATKARVWRAIYNGTWTGTLTVTGTTAVSSICSAYATGTFNAASPIDGAATEVTPVASPSMSIGTVTTVRGNCRLVSFVGGDKIPGGLVVINYPTGFSGRSGTGNFPESCALSADLLQPAPGASAASNVTQPLSAVTIAAVLLAVRPSLPPAVVIAGPMGGLDGNVAMIIGIDHLFAVAGPMGGLDGSIGFAVARQSFTKPRREYIWIRNYQGVVLDVLS